jgi:hypothetical protein
METAENQLNKVKEDLIKLNEILKAKADYLQTIGAWPPNIRRVHHTITAIENLLNTNFNYFSEHANQSNDEYQLMYGAKAADGTNVKKT